MFTFLSSEYLSSLFNESETIIIFLSIIAVTIILSELFKRKIQRKLDAQKERSAHHLTQKAFIKHLAVALIRFIGLGLALTSLPIGDKLVSSIVGGFGISSIIIGFASQKILGNFFSGIILILKSPYKIDDVIVIQGTKGTVIEVNLYDTILEDESQNKIIVPNSLIAGTIINVHANDV